MLVTKVRVLLGGALRERLGLPEVLAYVPLGGTAEDLRRHLEDAWPGAGEQIRSAPLRVSGRNVAADAPLPERTPVRLG